MITKMRESDCDPERHGHDKVGLDGNGQGFFYDEDIPEEVEEGDSIADRVSRRWGCHHLGEGQME